MSAFINAKNNIVANAYENAFIMLRLGQYYLENGDIENTKEYLLRVYPLEDREISQDTEPKYW